MKKKSKLLRVVLLVSWILFLIFVARSAKNEVLSGAVRAPQIIVL